MPRQANRAPTPRLVDNRNRVALTREVLRALNIRPGDYITFIVNDAGDVRLCKLDITVAPTRRTALMP